MVNDVIIILFFGGLFGLMKVHQMYLFIYLHHFEKMFYIFHIMLTFDSSSMYISSKVDLINISLLVKDLKILIINKERVKSDLDKVW